MAAADDTGRTSVIADAARAMGLPGDALDLAERTGVLDVGAAVRFRQPLLRAAAYRGAPPEVRKAAHRALARVFARESDVRRQAAHLAASHATDAEMAAELEATAARLRDLGRHAAAAEACERAASFGDTGGRLVAAAEAALAAGKPRSARLLAARAVTADAAVRLRAAAVRGRAEYEVGSASLAARLLTAAGMPVDAADAARTCGDLKALREAGRALADGALESGDLVVVRAWTAAAEGDTATGLRLLCDVAGWRPDRCPPRLRPYVADAALLVGDDEAAVDVAALHVLELRGRGLTGLLARVLPLLARAQLMRGAHREARALIGEGRHLARRAGSRRLLARLDALDARLAATRGDFDRARALAVPAVGDDVPARSWAVEALVLLDLISGTPERVFGRRDLPVESLPDVVAAAVAAGTPGEGQGPADAFAEFAEACGKPWAQAVASRCRALLAPDGEAGEHFERAVRLHRKGGRPFERARTDLLYGRWLRGERRRDEAQVRLRSAVELFEHLDAEPWAERARAELRAAGSGEPAAASGGDRLGRLSPHELQVVRLAAAGASNREIGARLSVSHRTVGYHLNKAFPKLGVASRLELARFVLDEPAARMPEGRAS
ncbi:LuxR C-terminal-related transcriptional regulator [Spirillospora sp. NPDC048911]|uniref:LuxR C-terminal-related transcriptional regulator n=1 Tax=Spirillospora sp. NPDC048911 TaxID=3364527 RepID=UPI0037170053